MPTEIRCFVHVTYEILVKIDKLTLCGFARVQVFSPFLHFTTNGSFSTKTQFTRTISFSKERKLKWIYSDIATSEPHFDEGVDATFGAALAQSNAVRHARQR